MSDEATIRRAEIRQLRGRILRCLHTIYASEPNTVTGETIKRTVQPDSHQTFFHALVYLVDPGVGLITRQAKPVDKLDRDPLVVYCLSAKGLQVVEGTVEDSGVEL